MTQKFYVRHLGEVKGPFSIGEVLRYYSTDNIDDATLVWDCGCRLWFTFGRLKELLLASARVFQEKRPKLEAAEGEVTVGEFRVVSSLTWSSSLRR